MAFDHYLAICYPLHYSIITNSSAGCWLLGVQFPGYLCAGISDHKVVLQLPNHHQPFLFQQKFLDSPLLYGHVHHWDGSFRHLGHYHPGLICDNSPFIHLYHPYYSENPFSQRLEKDLFHLPFPSWLYGTAPPLNPPAQNSLEMTLIPDILNAVETQLPNPFINALRENEMKKALGNTICGRVNNFQMAWRSFY